MVSQKSFIIQPIVLPACSGKTTLHNERFNIIDAGSVCDKSVVRYKRNVARETNDWETFDIWWANEILTNLPNENVILLIPSITLSKRLSFKNPHIVAIELLEWLNILDQDKTRNRDHAIDSYTNVVFDERCVVVASHDMVREFVLDQSSKLLSETQ
jgi:hypothetical protein